MKCPNCGYTGTKVIDSRPRSEYIYRRRECPNCGQRFNTDERIKRDAVIESSGRIGKFTPDGLLEVLRRICGDHPLTDSTLKGLAIATVTMIQDRDEDAISTTDLIQLVIDLLREIDPVAFVYVQVYLLISFQNDIGEELAGVLVDNGETISER